jgi:hypothetical protein
MTSALVAAKATLIPSPSLHPPRAGKLKHSAVCNTQCRSTGVSPRESAKLPIEVKEVVAMFAAVPLAVDMMFSGACLHGLNIEKIR